MLVYVVRHACAGRKEEWPGRDADRPLDHVGAVQAAALAAVLAERPLRRLLSSPTVRCIETIRPLARRTGLAVETSTALRVETPTPDVIALITSGDADQAALCTHGEVMRELFRWLRTSNVEIDAPDPEEGLFGKGTAWAIELSDHRPRALQHLAPVPVVECPDHAELP